MCKIQKTEAGVCCAMGQVRVRRTSPQIIFCNQENHSMHARPYQRGPPDSCTDASVKLLKSEGSEGRGANYLEKREDTICTEASKNGDISDAKNFCSMQLRCSRFCLGGSA